MLLSKNKTIFYASITKGHLIKGIIDLMVGCLSRINISIDKDGLKICDQDPKNHILFNIKLERDKFNEYRCKRNLCISINLRHFQKMLKNVKKKDSIVMYIGKNEKIFEVIVRSDGAKDSENSTGGTEKINIVYQNEEPGCIKATPEDGREEQQYYHAKVIASNKFQKVKKLTTMDKTILIQQQKDNYISFSCDKGGVFSNELSFGELTRDKDDSEDDEYSSEEEEEEEEETEIPDWYSAHFSMSLFSNLVKLPTLSDNIQFYQPRIEGMPIKVQTSIGNLGYVQIFMKDNDQIAYEESLSNSTKQNNISV